MNETDALARTLGDLALSIDQFDKQIDALGAAIIASGMVANPQSADWTAKEIAHDAMVIMRAIRRDLEP